MLVVHVAALPAVYHNHLPSAFFSHNHTNTYTCLSTHGRAQVARGKEGGGRVRTAGMGRVRVAGRYHHADQPARSVSGDSSTHSRQLASGSLKNTAARPLMLRVNGMPALSSLVARASRLATPMQKCRSRPPCSGRLLESACPLHGWGRAAESMGLMVSVSVSV